MLYLYGLLGAVVVGAIAITGAYAVHYFREAKYNIKVHQVQEQALDVIEEQQKKPREERNEKDIDCALTLEPC